ncbi:MAG: hypothetical protein JSS82_10335 [Bacteroidetes bacterium]|nr:hypothetical protein [Bacteroidota bacterium]
MILGLFTKYKGNTIHELVDRFYIDYYTIMEERRKEISDNIESLKNSGLGEEVLQYLERCGVLAAEIKNHLDYRIGTLLPYMHELGRKSAEGHNCATCSGGCHVGHSAKIAELSLSHASIKNTLEGLRGLEPVAAEDITGIGIETIQDEIQFMENALAELYYLEQEVLVPKLREAQRRINANG